MISLNPWVVFTILYRDYYSIFHTSYIQLFVLTPTTIFVQVTNHRVDIFYVYISHICSPSKQSHFITRFEKFERGGGNFSSFSLIKSWLSIFKKCKKDFNMRSSIQDFLEGAASITSNKPQWSKVPKINFYVQNIYLLVNL